MTDPVQQPLFEPPKPVSPLRPLTERQQTIYQLVCSIPGGISADELGALLHERRGSHNAGERCEHCAIDGKRALRERGIRQRVIRRTGSLYEAREKADRAETPTLQQALLAGETWEDMFGLGDAA